MTTNLTYKNNPKDFLSNLNMSGKVTQVNFMLIIAINLRKKKLKILEFLNNCELLKKKLLPNHPCFSPLYERKFSSKNISYVDTSMYY